MAESINPIVTIYQMNGTELMQCRYAGQDAARITLMISLPEFIRLSNLQEDVLLVLTSPTLGLLPYICTLLPDSLTGTNEATEQHMKLDFLIREKKQNIQRRRDYKVKTDIELDVKLTGPLHGDCHGKIEDLSAGGILFATEWRLEIGQEFTFLFEQTKTPLQLTARVLNIYRNDRIKRYGCALQELSTAEEETLRQCVFQIEAQRRRGNG